MLYESIQDKARDRELSLRGHEVAASQQLLAMAAPLHVHMYMINEDGRGDGQTLSIECRFKIDRDTVDS